MIFSLIYQRRVQFDIAEAILFFKKKRPGLEEVFTKAVRNTLNHIIKNPFLFQKRYGDIRVAYTKIFPFGIHYFVDEEENSITVLAVFHTSKDPENWEDRKTQ